MGDFSLIKAKDMKDDDGILINIFFLSNMSICCCHTDLVLFLISVVSLMFATSIKAPYFFSCFNLKILRPWQVMDAPVLEELPQKPGVSTLIRNKKTNKQDTPNLPNN